MMEIKTEDLATLIYTSRFTRERPKGVMLRTTNLVFKFHFRQRKRLP